MAGRSYLAALATCVLAMMAVAFVDGDDKTKEIEKFIRRMGECQKNPSISVLAYSLGDTYQGAFPYMKGFNNVSPFRSQPTSFATRFCIGEATQAFTAVLLAKLMELNNGTITWDTPVSRIIKMNLGIPDAYINENLSLKDIFGMRSGLSGMDIVPLAKPFQDVNEAIKYIRFAPAVGSFRNSYVENKVLFAYVDLVLRQLGSDSWENLLKKHILEPLGMTDTIFLNSTKDWDSTSTADGIVYSKDEAIRLTNKSYAGLDLVAPEVSLCTSARDLNKWFRFLLDERLSATILSKEALDATLTPISVRPPDTDQLQVEKMEKAYQEIEKDKSYSFSRNTASLGWILGQYRGWPTMSQDGSIPGYQTLITIIPSKKIAVYTTVVGDESISTTLVKTLINHHMIDTILDLKSSWLNVLRTDSLCTILYNLNSRLTTRSNIKYPLVDSSRSGDLQPELYEASYLNYAFGNVKVHREPLEKDKQGGGQSRGGEKSLFLTYGLITYELKPTNENYTFAMWAISPDHQYTTSANFYGQRRLFARFTLDDKNKEHWVQTVTIEGFAKDAPVAFSTYPESPQRDEVNQQCNAAQWTVASVWLLTLLTLVSLLR